MGIWAFIKKHQLRFGLLCFAGVLLIIWSGNAKAATHSHPHAKTHVSKTHSVKTHRHTKLIVRAKYAHLQQVDQDWLPRIIKAQKLLSDDQQQHYASIKNFDWGLAVDCGGKLTKVLMKQDGSNAQGFRIVTKLENYLNTRFSVVGPKGCVVLAQKRVINAKGGLEEAVYTAYSPELDTATMRKQGLEYLKGLRDDAFDMLETRKVPSVAFGFMNKKEEKAKVLVSDKILPRMALILAITEHIDPGRLRYVTLNECVHEVLITLAANREHAYEYAVSSVGARGLPQFMPDTYERIKSFYPEANLVPGFVEGMRNQVNAEAASLLHFDLELTELPQAKREWFVRPKNDLQAAPYFAAGYNWNAALVARAFAKYGHWTKHLPAETQKYVEIQRLVARDLGLT